VAFDKRRLQQVLLNLLSNATKFQSTGTIHVTLHIGRKDLMDDKLLTLEVAVKDTGIGMAQTEVDNIFRPFYRSTNTKSRNLNQSGNGVGLSICRQICRCLGGNITVRSKLGNGSTFTFTMDANLT